LTDAVYASVKASSRKGQLLREQGYAELVALKSLKDFTARLRERYPKLAAVSGSEIKEVEGALLSSFSEEADEFSKFCPALEPVIGLIKQESDEDERVEVLKYGAGNIDLEAIRTLPKRISREEALSLLKKQGYGEEVEEGLRLYGRFNIPSLLKAVFTKHRLLRLIDAVARIGMGEELKGYLDLKVDSYNATTLLRALRNEFDPKAIEELLIYGAGEIGKERLRAAARSGNAQKMMAVFEGMGLEKAEGLRDIERSYEKRIFKNLRRIYYAGYVEAGSVIGYLELKLTEVKNLIRIANAIERGIDPKRALQDFAVY